MAEQQLRKKIKDKVGETATIDESLLCDVTTCEEKENAIESCGPMKVNELESEGISSADCLRLSRAGYVSVESVAYAMRRNLVEVEGLSEAKVARIIKSAQKLVPIGFSTATSLYQQRAEMIKICTGSAQLDKLLGGGIETGSITEIIGDFRTGKSQLCHQLIVCCQLPISLGGAGGKALFLDTSGCFRPERVISIAQRYNLDPNAVLNNISYTKVPNSEAQMQLLQQAAEIMIQARYAILVVDSATELFRTDYQGRGELADRQQSLARFMRLLQKLSYEFGVAVVVTNQVVANVDGGMYSGENKKPIGGHIMGHMSHSRLMLRKGKGNVRICKIYSSPSLAEGEAKFEIQSDGITDETVD
ncbi:hypothetical protein SNEBB_006912 [Seison nebaliae]|nr:hypothetical protein SNEBB_006912 [Seison nebaliae]